MDTFFYPYRTAAEQIELSVALDGVSSSSSSVIELFELSDDTFSLSLDVYMRPKILRAVLDESELGDPPVSLYVTLRSDESRLRESYRLGGLERDSFVLSLDRNMWRGTVEVQAFLARTRASSTLPQDFGRDRGAALAWSHQVRILLDAPPSPPGNQMTIRWESFTSTRRASETSLFAIDTDGEIPAVVLNLDITHFQRIMAKLGTHGKDARVRDATSYVIVHQVWSSLLGAIFVRLVQIANDIDRFNDGADTDAILGELGTFDESIVREWAPFLYPRMDRQSALVSLIEQARNPSSLAQILTRQLPDAIQQRFGTAKGFEGLIKDFDRL